MRPVLEVLAATLLVAAGCERAGAPLEGRWRSARFRGAVGEVPASFQMTLTFRGGAVLAENECEFPTQGRRLRVRTEAAASADTASVAVGNSSYNEVQEDGLSCTVSLAQLVLPYRIEAESLYLGDERSPLSRVP